MLLVKCATKCENVQVYQGELVLFYRQDGHNKLTDWKLYITVNWYMQTIHAIIRPSILTLRLMPETTVQHCVSLHARDVNLMLAWEKREEKSQKIIKVNTNWEPCISLQTFNSVQ